MVVWFCRRLGGVFKTPINKLAFYADFLNFKTATVSLTGMAYRKVNYGPVPTDYGSLLDWMEGAGILVCHEVEFQNGNTGYRYEPGPEADSVKTEFSEHEERVLEHVACELGRMTPGAISDRSHKESAWQDAEPREIISYQKARLLSLSLPR